MTQSSMPRASTSVLPCADAELARRAAAGDRWAFDELARRHAPRMLAVCLRVTRDEQDARDALQEALVAAWRNLDSFGNRSAVGTWLYRVAANAAVDEVRRRSRRPLPADAEAFGSLAGTPGPSPEDQVGDRLAVAWALERLPVQFRTALVLREICGYSYRSIAEARSIPVDTVKSQISRGRRAVAQLLRE